MLAIISPAKTLDFETKIDGFVFSQPELTAYSQQLIDICKQFSPAEVASLMSISDKLASLNVARFAEWIMEHNEQNAKAALFAFKGDVYTGLEAETLTNAEIDYAQR
ncbi:peroxide stress protein YaaA, partial [Glaesserella parasuis]|nr:peroxide stress protein YaaA [Glaesserella parasuis]